MLWILLSILALSFILICHGRVTLTICLKSYLNLLAFFYKLRSRAQPQVLRMLCSTFVYPQLLYGVEVYANACKYHREKLIVLNNKLLHIAQNCSVRTCIVDVYKRYLTLLLPFLHEHNVLCFVHKCYKCKKRSLWQRL